MKQDDADRLIDLLLGQCDPEVESSIRRRLARDRQLRSVHDDVARALGAMSLAGHTEPPGDLADRTLARIRQHEQTNALLAREQLTLRARRPTFLLRELVAVAAILLVMLGAFALWRRQARRDQLAALCRGQVGQIGTGMLAYANSNGGFLPAANQSWRRWLPAAGQPAVSNSSGLFKLVVQEFVPPSVFRCPGVQGRAVSKAGFSVQPGMTDFPAAGHINYSYQHTLGGRKLSLKRSAAVAGAMAILVDSNPVFSGGRFRRERLNDKTSDNHDHTGQNVLYLDRHVAWVEGPDVGVGGDNIFLVEGVVDYLGDEEPADETDSFLLPAYSGH